ncbi:MAG: Uma2 family endonuclease [Aggregatilineales bacterium]
MSVQTVTIPAVPPAGDVVTANVSEAEYLAQYAEQRYEWAREVVIKKSPVSLIHDKLVAYIRNLFEAYFTLRPIGDVVGDPFVMRLAAAESNREPDLQVILSDNRANLKDAYMDGPADICIEVVSLGSVAVDYGVKLEEYEKGGVGEYWIVDPIRHACLFYRMTEGEVYGLHLPAGDGSYTTPRLPGFALHVPTLWQQPLPDYGAVWQAVQTMLQADN